MHYYSCFLIFELSYISKVGVPLIWLPFNLWCLKVKIASLKFPLLKSAKNCSVSNYK